MDRLSVIQCIAKITVKQGNCEVNQTDSNITWRLRVFYTVFNKKI